MICAEWISSQTAWVWGQKAPVTTNISMGENSRNVLSPFIFTEQWRSQSKMKIVFKFGVLFLKVRVKVNNTRLLCIVLHFYTAYNLHQYTILKNIMQPTTRVKLQWQNNIDLLNIKHLTQENKLLYSLFVLFFFLTM